MPDTPQTVADVMSRQVVTLFEEDSLSRIEDGMERLRFRYLPVVDGRKLVGLVTHSDILRQLPAWTQSTKLAQRERQMSDHFARDLMHTDVATVRPETRLADAARLMRSRKIGCLPVTDDDGDLVGIVTQSDFLSLAIEMLERGGVG